MDRLPPLSAVRVFEAAARHLSFTKAAAELGMTQAAVSYQIKQLEDRVGSALFRRLPRRLALTDIGQRLAPQIGDALGRLAQAFATVSADDDRRLSITSLYSFAANWLVPRLGKFQRAHPELMVWLDTSPRVIDLVTENVDVGIRTGQGEWPGLHAQRLMSVRLTPLLSPALAASIGGVREASDLLKLPLFEEDDDAWERWFEAAGHPIPPGSPRGYRMDTQQMLARAAENGQGVALLNPAFFVDEVATRRLMQPFPQPLELTRSFYVVCAKTRASVPKIRAFREWIASEVADV